MNNDITHRPIRDKRTFVLLLAFVSVVTLHASDLGETLKRLDSNDPSVLQDTICALRSLSLSELSVMRKLDGQIQLSPEALKLQKHILSESLFSGHLLPCIETNVYQEIKIRKIPEPLYLSREKKTILIPSVFKLEHGMLEYLLVCDGPSSPVHETILTTPLKGSDICVAMLACGYEALEEELPVEGGMLPRNSGVRISIQFEFEKPNEGMMNPEQRNARAENRSVIRVPIECFAFNSATNRSMRKAPFLFTGSFFEKSPTQSDASAFAADLEGPLVALKSNRAALINTALNTRDVDPQQRAGYAIDRFVIPERGSKCFVVLEPCEERRLTRDELNDSEK